MSFIEDGGPAFPPMHDPNTHAFGMTLRDYFIAHAPSEPQPWFEPRMPMPRPQRPQRPIDLTAEEKMDLEGWGDYYGTEALITPRAVAYGTASDAVEKEQRAWDAQATIERFIQWPAAWADAMLKARSS